MATHNIVLPAMGEGITDATVIKWLKQEGESIEEDESIVEIATDKVDSEVPSPVSGIVAKLVIKENETVKIGDTLAIISTDGKDNIELKDIQTNKIEIESNTRQIDDFQNKTDKSTNKEYLIPEHSQFLSPLVRNIIKAENIKQNELDSIVGSGLKNRITKIDILNFIKTRSKSAPPSSLQSAIITEEKQEFKSTKTYTEDDNVEIIQMDRIRKLIADHMIASKRTSPHVTSFIEADVTNMVIWRNKNKEEFQERYNSKLTLTHLFTEATINAIKEYPMINVSVDGSDIIKKKYVNIGMATALPNGNLIVPVLKKACQHNIVGLAKSVNDLANRARNNRLLPDEIKGGTFTITNFGTFGNIAGTPIINQPEVAILGLGVIQKKPVVLETQTGDAIVIRHMIILSLSYDHRVVDGALGGMFLKQIKENLESFDSSQKI